MSNWKFDRLEKCLIGISGALIVFTLFAPALFTQCSSKIEFGEKTGQIGDTIGGVMNPFITLAGVLITFLAFYIQYKANKEQRKLFDEGLKENRKLFEESLQAEKDKEIRKEKLECYHYLSLLQNTLKLIINDFEKKTKHIEAYYKEQKEHKNYKIFVHILPFAPLTKLPIKNYLDKQDIDRLALYKGFKILLNSREKWLEEYIDLYDALISLKELDGIIEDIYQTNDSRLETVLEKNQEIENQIEYLLKYYSEACKVYPSIHKNIDEIIGFILEEHRMMPLIDETHRRIDEIYSYLIKSELSQDRNVSEIIFVAKQLFNSLANLTHYTYSFASEMETKCSEITGDEGYLTKLKRSKLILDQELAKIDVEKL